MPGTDKGLRAARAGSAYRTARAIVKKTGGTSCHICGDRIPERHELPRCAHPRHRRDTGCPTHPLAWSLDHTHPLSAGGSRDARRNGRPAHYGCNASRGNGTKRSRVMAKPRVEW